MEKEKKRESTISNIIFYFIIVSLVFVAFIYSQQSHKGRNVFGYSYFNILTTSMQSEIPAGSFILVKVVDSGTLKVGDDITFFQSEDIIITHRIIDIIEDYESSGQLGFQTMGVDNYEPDREITYEGNIIGKVIWHIPVLGFILEFIASHIVIVIILFCILVLIAFFLRIVFGPEDNKKGVRKP